MQRTLTLEFRVVQTPLLVVVSRGRPPPAQYFKASLADAGDVRTQGRHESCRVQRPTVRERRTCLSHTISDAPVTNRHCNYQQSAQNGVWGGRRNFEKTTSGTNQKGKQKPDGNSHRYRSSNPLIIWRTMVLPGWKQGRVERGAGRAVGNSIRHCRRRMGKNVDV